MDASTLDPELERLLDHSDWLRALARKLVGDAATADDLVQETWLAAMKSPPDPARPVRPWLAGVVRRLARMRARGEGRRARRQTEAAKADALPSTMELVENVDTQRRLAAVVMELSEPYRTTVMLRYFEGMSSADIARRQGVPSGTVRWRLKRGLDELRERLDSNYGSRNAWCLAFLALERTQYLIAGTSAATTIGGATLGGWAAAAAAMAALGIPVYLYNRPALAAGTEALVAFEPARESSIEDRETAPEETELARVVSIGEAVLRLEEEDQRSTAGLHAVLVLPTEQVIEGKADAEGVLSFSTTATSGTLVVAREGSFWHVEEMVFDGEEKLVRLPAGSSLVGTLVDQAGAPIEGSDLVLDSDRTIYGGREFPKDVERYLGTSRTIRRTTDADGFFTFRGLPAEWSGELALPQGVALAGMSRQDDQGASVHVEGPRSDLVVEVQRLPEVTGLVRDPKTTYVAGAEVRIWIDNHDKPIGVKTGVDGRFLVQLDAMPQEALRIEAEAADGGGLRSIDVPVEDLLVKMDLGEIELLHGLAQEFEVLEVTEDQGIVPVKGAVARQVGTKVTSQPTNSVGMGKVELQEGAEPVIEIDAPGFLSARHDIGGLASVSLERAAELKLKVKNSKGEPLPSMVLEVFADERLFAEGEPYAPSDLDQVTMAGRPGELKVGDDFGRFILSTDGELTLPGVATGKAIRVEVYDKLGQHVASADVDPLSSDQNDPVEIPVMDAMRTLEALVSDQAGNLLVGALVEIAAEESHQGFTQDDGKASFDQLSTDRVKATVSMRGFATQVYTDYVLPAPGQPATFTLEPGHDVEVLVQDTLGQPVSGGRVLTERGAGVSVSGVPALGSEQKLEDLAGSEQTVSLYVGGLRYQQLINPTDGRVTFTVPLQVQLGVNWTLPETEGDSDFAFRIMIQPGTPEPDPAPADGAADGVEAELEAEPVEGEVAAEAVEAPEAVEAAQRYRVVHNIASSTNLQDGTVLPLSPGTWIVTLESSALRPAKGPWTVIGEPVLVTVDLDQQAQVQLGTPE